MRRYFPILLILTLAFILRLIALLTFGDFWFDEMFTYIYSQKSWTESFQFWIWETNPPLHMFIMKGWFAVFPPTEFWARFPSLLFGVATLGALYSLSKKIFNERVALVAALLLSLYPYHILFSAMARGYALLMLLSVLALDSFYTVLKQEAKGVKRYAYFLSVHILLIYTHLTAAVIFASEITLLMFFQRKKWKEWLAPYFFIALSWLPWAIPSAAMKATKETISLGWFFNIHTTLTSVSNTIQPLFGGFGVWKLALVTVGIGTAILGAGLAKAFRARKITTPIILVCTPVMLTIVGIILFGLWNFKFSAIIVPFAALLIGWSLTEIRLHSVTKVWIVALMLAPGLSTLYMALPMMSWKPLNECMAENARADKKHTLIYLDFPFKILIEKYYREPNAALGYYPDAGGNWDYNLITKNYWRSVRPMEETTRWAEANKLSTYDELFVMATHDNNGVPIDRYLIENNWKPATNACRNVYLDNKRVTRYVKN